MDKFNFGSSQAAQILVQLIEELPNPYEREKVQRKVSRFLAEYNTIVADLDPVTKDKTRRFLFMVLRRDVLDKRLNLPKDIGTFSKNVIIANLRESLLS